MYKSHRFSQICYVPFSNCKISQPIRTSASMSHFPVSNKTFRLFLSVDVSFPRVKSNMPSVPMLRCLISSCQIKYALCFYASMSHFLVSCRICPLFLCKASHFLVLSQIFPLFLCFYVSFPYESNAPSVPLLRCRTSSCQAKYAHSPHV